MPVPEDIYGITAMLEKDSLNPNLYYQRSLLQYNGGNFEGALQDLERAMRIDSTNPEYFYLLADVFLETGNLSKARLATDAAMIKFPNEPQFPLKAAQLEIFRREYTEAIKLLDEVLKKDISNPEAYFWKGILFKEIGDTNKSISNFQTCVEQDPNYYEAYMQLGVLHSARNDNFAISYFDNARKVKPDEIEPLYFKGVYLQNTGKHKEALKVLKTVAVEKPRFAKAHFKIGINLYQLDSLDKAYRSFDRAIQTDPQFHEAFYMKGLCAEALGKYPEALKLYKQTLNFNPDNQLAASGIKRIEKL